MKLTKLLVNAVVIVIVNANHLEEPRPVRWIVPNGSWVIAANGSPGEPVDAQRTSWASRCVTADDRETVEAKCATYKSDMAETKGQKFVEDCVQKYCDMVELKAGCGKNCEAATLPGTREECERTLYNGLDPNAPCKHYRLGWRLGGSDDAPTSEGIASLVPRLVKLRGTNLVKDTKWLLLPYLGFRSQSVSMEYQETDFWHPDLGAIEEAWLHFDTNGKFSKLKEAPSRFHARFNASFLRVIPVGEDLVTDIGFLEGPCHENTDCKASTVASQRKWYDLVDPSPVCRGYGEERVENGYSIVPVGPILCHWWREDNYYGNFVPSWRERKEMVLVNAIRTNAKTAFTKLYNMTRESAVDFFHQCESPGYPADLHPAVWDDKESLATSTTSFWAPPFYYNSAASEGTRLWAYELAKNTTYVPYHYEFNGTDIYSRVEAHTGTHLHCPDTNWLCDHWPVAASGGQKTSGTGAVGVVGEAPFRGNCDHYRALMDPHRTMAAVGLYPSADWDSSNPTVAYTDPVHMFFDDHSHNPYSNEYFLTYQPIPSGTHMLIDNNPDGVRIRFMAQYYTTRRWRGLGADSFEVVVNGVPYELEFFSMGPSVFAPGTNGIATLETFTVDVAWDNRYRFGSLSVYGCLSYYFRATNDRGNFTLPQSGKYVFRTYGWKGCMESYAPSDEKVDGAFGSSCGYPGKPCPPTERECEKLWYPGIGTNECLNAGCASEWYSGDCALNAGPSDEDESSGGRFSVIASLMVSVIVALTQSD